MEQFSGIAADIWALGVTLFCMLFNKLPFWDESEYGIIQRIHSDKVELSDVRNISEGLQSLTLRLLEKDPSKRITIEQIKENEWLNEGYKTMLSSIDAQYIGEITESDVM